MDTECTFGDLNSNLVVPWWPHGKPCGSPVMSDLSLNLSECSVRIPFSHFVCAISVLLVWKRILAIYRQHGLYQRNRWYQWG
ncbi:hypothetical protein E2C01_099440 [Portunus trituberculatus]|uniref:Uncharacterized protein n=1 Tax=Portunus trituberculatus TaxID=210409 RepID=A0A5B7KAD5_PORTR|nr:hypothetical protein [Portunus trituberculatus]